MEFNEELIKKIAANARLNLTEEEVKKFLPQLKEIMEFFSTIDEVDVKDEKSSFQPVSLRNALREDEVKESLSQEMALANTKHKKEGYFKGPKIV